MNKLREKAMRVLSIVLTVALFSLLLTNYCFAEETEPYPEEMVENMFPMNSFLSEYCNGIDLSELDDGDAGDGWVYTSSNRTLAFSEDAGGKSYYIYQTEDSNVANGKVDSITVNGVIVKIEIDGLMVSTL